MSLKTVLQNIKNCDVQIIENIFCKVNYFL